MPVYTFCCNPCEKTDSGVNVFDLTMGMNDDRNNIPCPNCSEKEHVSRIFNVPAIKLDGLTAIEKSAGTTKHRADLGKFMKDQRDKRQRQAEPGTLAKESNELWAGNALPEGIKPPSK